MPGEDEAWARLAGTLASALQAFAESAGTHDEPEPVAEQPPNPADEHALGKRQRQIVELTGLTTEEGLRTADIAARINYEIPNTYTALQALARWQVVEQVPNREPQHWRLVRRYRATSQVYINLVKLLQPDEWTTAGDVSIAARGDLRAADSIARAALSPQVLATQDADPEKQKRVTWLELSRRAAIEARRRTMTTQAVLNYLQIPAVDLEQSVTFYEAVFGWRVKRHPAVGDVIEQSGYPEFTDSTGRAGGGFVLGRPASREPGLLPCVAVHSIDAVLEAVVLHGGEVVKPRTPIVEGADYEAIFRDPAGNAMGLYEERSA